MLASLNLEPIALAAGSVHRIENAKGITVSCVRGPTWVTQESDPRDLILAAGQSFVLDRPGLAIVYAFREAVITVGTGWQVQIHARHGGNDRRSSSGSRQQEESRHSKCTGQNPRNGAFGSRVAVLLGRC